jgi:hypothetical protein
MPIMMDLDQISFHDIKWVGIIRDWLKIYTVQNIFKL